MTDMPSLSEQADHELGREILASKSETAFCELYRRHAQALCRFLRLAGGLPPGELDDIHQEVWIRAMTRLSSFRWDASFRTWLFGIAVNLCRESRRRGFQEATLGGQGSDDVSALSTPPSPALRMDLQSAIDDLPPGYRQILVLHDVEGYTHEEIARLLGIDEGTSKSQLSRARRAVRARWNPTERSIGGTS
jgi:RNA polymerase sigma-70 factor, ECF subfamily